MVVTRFEVDFSNKYYPAWKIRGEINWIWYLSM